MVASLAGFLFIAVAGAAEMEAETYLVGVAKIDITPNYPVRLSGFGFRRTESEGVTQRIWAKALAIQEKEGKPAVLIAVDNCGAPAKLVEEVARRLEKKAAIARDRLAVTATHTHTAPMLTGFLPTLFGQPIPKDHQQRIDRYTADLTDKLERVALAALADRKPAQLSWGIGTVGFAANRRTKGGPVDHDLPVLVARDLAGKVRAVYVSYACHCVTLSNNKISGDWAGYAQQAIQDEYSGAIALVSIGCGADSNPHSGVTGDKIDLAGRQGLEIAREVKRLLSGYLAPVRGKPTTSLRSIELPLAPLPDRAEWEARAKRNDAIGYHARVQLSRLDRGESLRTKIDYPVQTWKFGDSLAMVFLPGEVVVDYSLRLKRELDHLRLWVNAYTNDAPCYIPSERVLREGGYEGGGAMVYYDVPGPFQSGLENKIVAAVHEQVGKDFLPPFDPKRIQGSGPLSPQQSLAAIRTKDKLKVELMAAEPLVVSPVAIDFGPDGRLWVAEMLDYPAGLEGNYKSGGRIRVLESTRGDGVYDKATVFLDNLPFPTGVTVWRKGVLICAAPDIIYAEDTDGDGKADFVGKLFSGFGTDNFQARVNSLCYGLDNWVYGSCGLFGGKIQGFPRGPGGGGPVRGPVNLGDRDFRINLDTGAIEPATGRTQQGRVRDDWGNWFGCDNSNLCWHYPLADHYLRRNPHVAPPNAAVLVPDSGDPNRLYPIRSQLQLFKLSGPPNRTTAACGLGIYRDDLLGPEYRGNAFTCEPVNLIVHRLQLSPKGSTFSGRRPADETQLEFLASTDNWFRPVQVRTGPDGCLWVVDMYRHVIEHPRWIPPEDLAKLDVRAGSTMGRIYRVRPKDREPRPFPKLDKFDRTGLVPALDSPNGWQRDLAGQMLLWRADPFAVNPLEQLVLKSSRPEARLHALCVLDGMGKLNKKLVLRCLGDPHPGVRRHAVRLSEKWLADSPELGSALLKLVEDENAQVRLQLAYSLGEWPDSRAGRALATLALQHPDDPYLLAAVLSSVTKGNVDRVVFEVLAALTKPDPLTPPSPPGGEGGVRGDGFACPHQLLQQLVAVATLISDQRGLAKVLEQVTRARKDEYAPWQMAALAGILDAWQRRGQSLNQLADGPARQQIARVLTHASTIATDEKATEAERQAAVQVLGREKSRQNADLATLAKLLVPQNSAALQTAVLGALGRIPADRVAEVVVAGWKSYSPVLRSQVLDLLMSRESWQRNLLASIEKKEIPAAQIDAARRQRLLAHKDARLRGLATKLFSGARDPDRQKVLRDYQDVISFPGDKRRGKEVFAKRCAVCHRLEDVGHAVGPDLAALANKSAQYLLTSILDPSREVDSRYIEYLAVTKAGRTFTGILVSETATSITLKGQEAKEQVLLRSELEELNSTGKSLMPEGLEKDLSKQDFADLIEYLNRIGAQN
jgi:putative membrane-bound dehydrogenase-like protein